jgi:hypothetical protein
MWYVMITILTLIVAVPGAMLSSLLLKDRWKKQEKKPDRS